MHATLLHWGLAVGKLEAVLPLRPEHTRALLAAFRRAGRATLAGDGCHRGGPGALAGVGYWVTGVPEPVFFGIATAIASIVPAVGTLLVWVPAGVYLLISGHVTWGIVELAWGLLVVVGFSDYVIRPRLVGDENMPLLLTFIALFGGLEVLGVAACSSARCSSRLLSSRCASTPGSCGRCRRRRPLRAGPVPGPACPLRPARAWRGWGRRGRPASAAAAPASERPGTRRRGPAPGRARGRVPTGDASCPPRLSPSTSAASVLRGGALTALDAPFSAWAIRPSRTQSPARAASSSSALVLAAALNERGGHLRAQLLSPPASRRATARSTGSEDVTAGRLPRRQQPLDGRHQRRRLYRLRDVVVHPGPEGALPVALHGVRRHRDDRDPHRAVRRARRRLPVAG